MLKLVNNTFLRKMIISLCLVILIFTIICPIQSHALVFDNIGKTILTAIMSLVKVALDAAEGVMQYYFIGGPIQTFWVLQDNSDANIETFKKIGILPVDDSGKIDENAVVQWNVDKNLGTEIEMKEEDYDLFFSGWATYLASDQNASWQMPVTVYSPEAIFSNKIRAFDIDFVHAPNKTQKQDSDGKSEDEEPTEETKVGEYTVQSSIATDLRDNIAEWYRSLRMLAAACMLPILIYVGIRIIISSASEKAKYKEMFKDWLVAMCLLFVMHYIMAMIVNFTQALTSMLDTSYSAIAVHMKNNGADDAIPLFYTNLMGLARFRAEATDIFEAVANTVIYGFMVVYTLIFTWTYLKRVLMIAFLTLISPLIVLTYPLDKLHDGVAQGFNTWFKEYLVNALIQPFHLVLYTVLVGSAVSISIDNPLVAIAAMAFLLPAEKMLKKMFGLDKASEGAAGSNGFTGLMGAANLLANAKQLKSLGDLQKGKTNSGGGSSGSGTDNSLDYLNTRELGFTPGIGEPEPADEEQQNNNNNVNRTANNPGEDEADRYFSDAVDVSNEDYNHHDYNMEDDYNDMYLGGSGYGGGFTNYDDEELEDGNRPLPEPTPDVPGDTEPEETQDNTIRQISDETEMSEDEARQAIEQSDAALMEQARREEEQRRQEQQEQERRNTLRNAAGAAWAAGGKAKDKVVKFGSDHQDIIKAGAKRAAQGIATGVGAAAGGAAGLIYGSLSGDPSKAVSSAIKGATIGGAISGGGGTFVASKANKAIQWARYKHDPIGYLDKQQQKQSEQQRREYMRDSTSYRRAAAIAKDLGKDKGAIKEIQEQMYEMSQYGVTSMKDQARAIEMTDTNGNDLLENAWAVQKSKSVDYSDEKKRDAAVQGYMAEAERAGYANKNQQVEYALKKVDLVRSVKEKGYEGSSIQDRDHKAFKNKYGTPTTNRNNGQQANGNNGQQANRNNAQQANTGANSRGPGSGNRN